MRSLRAAFRTDIQRRIRRREWTALRPGAYVRPAELEELGERQRHLLLIAATKPDIPADAVLSHASAAQAHGIQLWEPSLRTVQVTRPGSGGGHRRRTLHTFRAGLESGDIVRVDGYQVTSPARTIVDLARQLPFEKAVVAADAALHTELATADELLKQVGVAVRRPGMCRAREVINFAEARRPDRPHTRTRPPAELKTMCGADCAPLIGTHPRRPARGAGPSQRGVRCGGAQCGAVARSGQPNAARNRSAEKDTAATLALASSAP